MSNTASMVVSNVTLEGMKGYAIARKEGEEGVWDRQYEFSGIVSRMDEFKINVNKKVSITLSDGPIPNLTQTQELGTINEDIRCAVIVSSKFLFEVRDIFMSNYKMRKSFWVEFVESGSGRGSYVVSSVTLISRPS